jgi:signal transduction histidine kinase
VNGIVASLAQGLKRLAGGTVSCILLDISLPDSVGTDGLIRLRKSCTDIPVVVLTGLDDKTVALECLKYGAQDYLVKGRASNESLVRVILFAIERKRSELALKQVKIFEQRENFIAMLAHDLRSPINGAERILSMVLDGLAGPISKEQTQMLSMLSGSNKSLLLMINNVLDTYKLESGSEKFVISKVDLPAAIQECVDDVSLIALSKNISLTFEGNGLISAYADVMALRRILWNLLSNALKFTPSGGSIQVQVSERGKDAVISVQDSGIGMSPEQLAKLYTRFFQSETKNRAAGLGLGLHLCKHLLDSMNGKINCSSVKDVGTVFEVFLPLAVHKPKSALIVDDNAVNLFALKNILQKLDINCTCVSDGEEALAASTSGTFDAIFMDIGMPGIDGLTTSREMRKSGLLAPIVAYTSSDQDNADEFREAGINDLLEKPANMARVQQIIDQWMTGPLLLNRDSDIGTNTGTNIDTNVGSTELSSSKI